MATLIERFRNARAKITTFESLKKFLLSEAQGYSFNIIWANGDSQAALGQVTGFINPPLIYSGIKSVYVVGDSEKEFIDKACTLLPRLFAEVREIEEQREADALEAAMKSDLQTKNLNSIVPSGRNQPRVAPPREERPARAARKSRGSRKTHSGGTKRPIRKAPRKRGSA